MFKLASVSVVLLALTAPAFADEPARPRREPGLQGRSDVVLSCDFEDADWWQAWGLKAAPANCAMVEGDGVFTGKGKSLQVTVPKGSTTGANFHFRFKQQLGAEPEEMYFRYYIKLHADWKNAVDGGKLPGFSGTYGKAGWGGRKVNGTDGWSVRGSFRKPGADSDEIGVYCYHADMRGKYGDIWKFTPPLQYGKWYCVETYCKMNTPAAQAPATGAQALPLGGGAAKGKNDGIFKAWIDGQVAFEKTDLRFRDVDTLKIETLWINVYHGGTTPTPEDIHLSLDNIVIARKPIGPVQVAKKGEPAASTAGSATELSKLAAEMKPGAWAELKTQGYTAELLKVQTHHILEYTDTAVWDPKSQQVLFVGQGHYSAVKFIAYDAAKNTWKLMSVPSWWKGDSETGKGPIGHAYNNNAIDPVKGLLYHHQSATRLVHRYDIPKEEWSTLPEIKDAPTGHGTALVYFPEMKGLVRVLAGQVHFYSEEKNAWSLLKDKVPMGPYHNVAKYNPVRKVVVFGAGNGSKDLYELDSKGEITKLPEAPFVIRISSTVVSVDPVSGDLLVLHMENKNKFFTLDLTKKEWKPLPDAPITSGVAAPIAAHGVTLYFANRPEKVFLYKHAATAGDK